MSELDWPCPKRYVVEVIEPGGEIEVGVMESEKPTPASGDVADPGEASDELQPIQTPSPDVESSVPSRTARVFTTLRAASSSSPLGSQQEVNA